MTESQPVIKFITKERFLRAKANGNYGEVSEDARAVIEAARPLDVLELRLREGSAYNVVSATPVTEERYLLLLRGAAN